MDFAAKITNWDWIFILVRYTDAIDYNRLLL